MQKRYWHVTGDIATMEGPLIHKLTHAEIENLKNWFTEIPESIGAAHFAEALKARDEWRKMNYAD